MFAPVTFTMTCERASPPRSMSVTTGVLPSAPRPRLPLRFPPYIRFVGLDGSCEIGRLLCWSHAVADAMGHEPCGTIANPKDA